MELVIVVGIVGILAAAVLPLARWSVKRQKEFELQANLRVIRNAIDRYHDLALAGLIEIDPGDTGYPPDLQVLVDGVELTGELPSPLPGVSDEYAATGAGLTGGLSGSLQSQSAPGAAAGGAADPTSAALAGAAGATMEELRGLLGERAGGGSRAAAGSGLGLSRGRLGGGAGLGLGRRGGFADRGRRGDVGVTGVEKLVFLRRLPLDPFTGDSDWGLRCYGDSIADRSWCGRNVFDVYSKGRGTGMDGRPYREW